MRVLLAEDDHLLGQGIRAGLIQEGYAVDWVYDGQTARSALMAEPYDLLVLDIGLPQHSGLEVLKYIRSMGNNIPTVILTARDTVQDRILGLDSGADDYLIKPFDLDELCARLRALSRRLSGRSTPIITHGDITIDPAAHLIHKGTTRIDLTPREYALLITLVEHAGKVQSRTRLEESLYPWHEEVESNTIEVHIHHLRKKLGNELIRTIRGIGYIIDQS